MPYKESWYAVLKKLVRRIKKVMLINNYNQ